MIGKLTSEQLNALVFKHLTYRRKEVLIRPSIGEDCAAIDFGEDVLIISTDPITGTASEIGKLAVNINLNDIATNGAAPLGIMITLMAPVGTPLEAIEQVMKQVGEEAAKHHVEVIGGHTEITDAVNRLLISAVAIAKQPKKHLIKATNLQVGDVILMTKTAGIEGTGIIAFEKAEDLSHQFGQTWLQEAQSLLDQTSVVKEGVLAGPLGVHAMHDITEGGLLGAVWEICEAAGLGCDIDSSLIPIASVTDQLCKHYDIDPLRLISSGSMLIVVAHQDRELVMKTLSDADIIVSEIGRITLEGRFIEVEGEWLPIEPPKGDVLYDVLAQ